MKRILRFTSLLVFLALLVSCGGSKDAPAVDNQEEGTYILVEQGGGVTGLYEEYVLQWNGYIYKWEEGDPNSKTKSHGSLSQAETSEVFSSWEKLKAESGTLPKPGNINYRIVYYSKEESYSVRWSDSQNIAPEIQEFFNSTFSKLKNAK